MAAVFAVLATMRSVQSTHLVDAKLGPPDVVIRSQFHKIDPTRKTFTYDGNVVAKYDLTTVYADHFFVDQVACVATATGNVHGIDPDISFTARTVRICWLKGHETGEAKDVDALIQGMRIRSKSFSWNTTRYEFQDFQASGGVHGLRLYKIRSHRLTIITGTSSRLERPRVSVFGLPTVIFPTVAQHVGTETSSTPIPLVTYRSGGFGVNYGPGFLLDPRTVLNTGYSVYQGSLPHYDAQISHSFVPRLAKDQGGIAPGSDLDQRFGFGYFDSVSVRSPAAEFRSLASWRDGIAFDAGVNLGATERLPGGSITKEGEFVYERGGRVGPLGFLSHARLQNVREQGYPAFIRRSEFDLSVGPPPLPVVNSLEMLIRFDGQGFVGSSHYSWVRSQFGLSLKPLRPLRLSAAIVAANEFGQPDFIIDRLTTDGGLYLRSDLRVGATEFSYLVKYANGGSVYDNEFSATAYLGSLRCILLYRSFPNEFKVLFGFQFNDLTDMLARRARRLKDINGTP